MIIAHTLPSLDPTHGGPMEGVYQLGKQLAAWGHSSDVITLDAPGHGFFDGFPGRVHALGPSRGGYRYNAKLVPWLKTHARRYDAIIINGLWQYHSFGAWRALKTMGLPYYVYPHGMLDPWFRRTYPLKHLKKWLYWPWAEYRVVRDARAVLFTSEEEQRLASQSFALYRARERVVAYGTGAPPPETDRLREAFLTEFPELRGRRILLYLGRLHRKKGCDLLIRAFAAVAAANPALTLVVAGPDQTGWAPALRELARTLSIADRVVWPGMLHYDGKWGAYFCAEAFVLSSHQENFGIAVAEALSCGVPVLISDKVNIWREIAAHRAGLVEPDDVEGTRRLLERWLALDRSAQQAMRESARQLFTRQFNVKAMASGLINLIEEQHQQELRQPAGVSDHGR